MEAHKSWSVPALVGCDYVREGSGTVMKRTKSGWEYTAKRMADKLSKRDGVRWTPVVAWIDWRECYRISFASQPYNIMEK